MKVIESLLNARKQKFKNLPKETWLDGANHKRRHAITQISYTNNIHAGQPLPPYVQAVKN